MLLCMRTTVRLDDHLLRSAKAHAATTGRTLTAVIEEGLRRVLEATEPAGDAEPYRVATFRSGARPGVDLDSNASTLEAMEG